jgi:hypothetical protein
MATPGPAPASVESPAPSPARRDWLDATIRLATSWIGISTAYLLAVAAWFAEFDKIEKIFSDKHIPLLGGILLVASVPLAAFVCSTIPAFIEQRRIRIYSEIAGALQTGYFTLRPREDEDRFERADNAQQEVLRWIETSPEPVLYLTGASGTGKSSFFAPQTKRVPQLAKPSEIHQSREPSQPTPLNMPSPMVLLSIERGLFHRKSFRRRYRHICGRSRATGR